MTAKPRVGFGGVRSGPHVSGTQDWAPLSVRTGAPHLEMQEGVPIHLLVPVEYWLEGAFGYRSAGRMSEGLVLSVAASIQLTVFRGVGAPQTMRNLIDEAAQAGGDRLLDLVDAVLHRGLGSPGDLRRLLHEGRSVWTVRSDGRGLERRVSDLELGLFEDATRVRDSATTELKDAWAAQYGRSPDHSDAWDHAIKAVETVLAPIICPGHTKPTLGVIIRELNAGLDSWRVMSSDRADGAATFVAMLRLMWPNPDRHGTGGPREEIAPADADAVLHLAVMLVRWCRSGLLHRP